jgi:hypothetical protein
MANAHRSHLVRREGDLGVSSNLDDAKLAHPYLIENRAVFAFDRDYLVADSCLLAFFQGAQTLVWNRK